MLYHLAEKFSQFFGPLNVLHYISFRSLLAFLLVFGLLMVVYRYYVPFIRRFHTSYMRDPSLPQKEEKKRTPHLGGVPLILTLILVSFIFLRLDTPYPYLAALTLLLFGLVGLIDDLVKLRRKRDGISVKTKLLLQIPFSLLLGFLIYLLVPIDGQLHFPFFKELTLDFGELYPLWAALFIFTFSTAVNLTDGLDGLAIGSTVMSAAVMGLVAYFVGNYIYAEYLYIPYVPYAGELTVLMAALIGGGLAFLWYNANPAKIFMGDTGSLALGALLAFTALATQSEFILIVAGGVFLFELASVAIQITVCRLTKKGEYIDENGRKVADCKRVFKIAPFHHHLQKLGWKEPEIVIRFWVISAVLAVISLTLLKLR